MSLQVKKILVPIAFSDNCLKNKKMADEIALQFGAEVELLHVVEASPYEVYQRKGILADPPFYEKEGGATSAAKGRYGVGDLMEETRNELERLASENTADAGNGQNEDGVKNVKYVTEVKHGNSVDEILRAIDKYQPDLVVMATHGRTGLKHMLLGSVTEKIVRLSPVPVWTNRV